MPGQVRVDVQFATHGAGIPSAARIRRWVRAALARRRAPAVVCVRIVDGRESRALNRRFRACDHATNVLSFESEHLHFVKPPSLGDIVLCAPVISREARRQGKTPAAHWAHLTVHGVLHLTGYRHGHAAQARSMEAREISILRKLGYPDPYLIADHP